LLTSVHSFADAIGAYETYCKNISTTQIPENPCLSDTSSTDTAKNLSNSTDTTSVELGGNVSSTTVLPLQKFTGQQLAVELQIKSKSAGNSINESTTVSRLQSLAENELHIENVDSKSPLIPKEDVEPRKVNSFKFHASPPYLNIDGFMKKLQVPLVKKLRLKKTTTQSETRKVTGTIINNLVGNINGSLKPMVTFQFKGVTTTTANV